MVDKKIIGIVILCCIAGIFIIGGMVALELKKVSKFEPTEAKIINAITNPSTGTTCSRPNFVVYEFEISGEKYQATKQVFGDAVNRIGKTERIKYNPQNPEEIENTYKIRAGIIAISFFTVFLFVLMLSLKSKQIR